jgi:hypothetical protein
MLGCLVAILRDTEDERERLGMAKLGDEHDRAKRPRGIKRQDSFGLADSQRRDIEGADIVRHVSPVAADVAVEEKVYEEPVFEIFGDAFAEKDVACVELDGFG